MKFARADRSLLAWTLYGCVLFNLLACAIGHGQMAGLLLGGLGGAFCSAAGNAGPELDSGFADGSDSQLSLPFSCPLCSAAALGFVLFFGLSWLPRHTGLPRLRRERRSKASPRYSWPSANPRASP